MERFLGDGFLLVRYSSNTFCQKDQFTAVRTKPKTLGSCRTCSPFESPFVANILWTVIWNVTNLGCWCFWRSGYQAVKLCVTRWWFQYPPSLGLPSEVHAFACRACASMPEKKSLKASRAAKSLAEFVTCIHQDFKKNIRLQRFSFQEFWYFSCFCANVAPAKWKWLFPDRFSRISLLFSFETWTWRGWLRLWYHGMEHDDGTVKRCPDWDFMEQRTLFQGESMGRRPGNDWTHPNHFKDLKSRNLNS